MRLLFAMGLAGILLAGVLAQESSGLTGYDEVAEWGTAGTENPGEVWSPQSVDVGEDGFVYLSELGNKRIQKFSLGGHYVLGWGSGGKEPGEFLYPAGIAATLGHVFVADREMHRVQKFTTQGEFVASWGSKGSGDGQFFLPSGVAANNGTVYVVDTGNSRVQAFDEDGQFVASFGTSGLGDAEFVTATGIDIDRHGDIYVTDKGQGKVVKFTAGGEFIGSYPFEYPEYTFAPTSIAVGPGGEMLVMNDWNGRILYLSADDSPKMAPADKKGPYRDSFGMVSDITLGPNGELLVVDMPNNRVHLLETPFYDRPESLNVYTEPLPVPEVKDTEPPVITAPRSLIIDAQDRLTVINIGNATATDEGGVAHIINNAPASFGPGVSNVVWIAFDTSGHSSEAYQTIDVRVCGKDKSLYNLIEGTDGGDIIRGTAGDDLIFGLGGDDIISGGLGNDCIFGGEGDDVISGDAGDDTLKGNGGTDIINGNAGDDLAYPGPGPDVVNGGDGADRCFADDSDLLVSCE